MIGFGIGILCMMGLNIYNQYRIEKYYTDSYLKYKAEVEKLSTKYK